MRLLKGLIFFLAIGGTAALVMAARAVPRTLTTIDRIQPAMNYAYVRVAGAVVAHPARTTDDDFLSFIVADASGQIRVSAYRQAARALAAQGHVPAPGDHVELDGTLRVRDDDTTLILGDASALQITRPRALDVRLTALDAVPVGGRATTVGQIRRVRTVERLTIVTLRDGAAVADVPLPHDLFPVMPSFPPGTWLRVTGGVGEYRGARQLLPSAAYDVQRVAAPPSLARPIAALDNDLIDQWVTISGEVVDLLPFAQGTRLQVHDGVASMDVMAFDSVWQRVPFSETLGLGDVITVSGTLVEFRGRLEVMPELAVDLER